MNRIGSLPNATRDVNVGIPCCTNKRFCDDVVKTTELSKLNIKNDPSDFVRNIGFIINALH